MREEGGHWGQHQTRWAGTQATTPSREARALTLGEASALEVSISSLQPNRLSARQEVSGAGSHRWPVTVLDTPTPRESRALGFQGLIRGHEGPAESHQHSRGQSP